MYVINEHSLVKEVKNITSEGELYGIDSFAGKTVYEFKDGDTDYANNWYEITKIEYFFYFSLSKFFNVIVTTGVICSYFLKTIGKP